MLQYLGLILLIATWASGFYLVSRWRDESLSTISKHAASSRESIILFGSVLIGFGALFYYWIIRWFVPHLQLTKTFEILISLTMALQFVTGLVPDRPGWRQIVHNVVAYAMVVTYLPIVVLILLSPKLSGLPLILSAALGLYMLFGFSFVAVMGWGKQRYLYFQASYIVAFQLVILVAAYLKA